MRCLPRAVPPSTCYLSLTQVISALLVCSGDFTRPRAPGPSPLMETSYSLWLLFSSPLLLPLLFLLMILIFDPQPGNQSPTPLYSPQELAAATLIGSKVYTTKACVCESSQLGAPRPWGSEFSICMHSTTPTPILHTSGTLPAPCP